MMQDMHNKGDDDRTRHSMNAPLHLHGLEALERRLADDLRWLGLPAKGWVPETRAEDRPVLDVAVIGAGMLGLVTLAALGMIGVERVRAFDRAPAGREGPWVTFARMTTLRTRKEAAGPALGIGSLAFRGWFEAQFGADAFDTLERIPREMWMDYLVWYRGVLDLPVDNDTPVRRLEIRPDGLMSLAVGEGDKSRNVLARHVVIATGLDGLGAPALPEVARNLPRDRYAHGAEAIDVAALAGRRVAVIGAGASAMDNAAAALEAGAARVDIFVRRPDIPRIDKFSGVGSKGMTHGYHGLPDALKWAYMVEGERAQIPPPRHSVQRVSRHEQAHFHLASPITGLRMDGDAVEVTTPKGRYAVDFIIFTTGFRVDFSARPEFSALAGNIRLWRDAYAPPDDLAHPALGAYPYLGPGFEFQPAPGAPAAISRVHCFAYPAVPSHGKITSGIPSITDGANRLAQGIARALFVADGEAHLQRFRDFSTPELLGDEWQDADKDPHA